MKVFELFGNVLNISHGAIASDRLNLAPSSALQKALSGRIALLTDSGSINSCYTHLTQSNRHFCKTFPALKKLASDALQNGAQLGSDKAPVSCYLPWRSTLISRSEKGLLLVEQDAAMI